MTTQPSFQTAAVDRLPRKAGFFANLSISNKLILGFGILVILSFISVAISFLSSYRATTQIERTDVIRVPSALAASKAQADLLRMLGDVRGYLALGDPAYRQAYEQSSKDFEADLAALEKYAPELGEFSNQHLDELKTTYDEWKALPEPLFELRDDQLDREPAYRLLATDGVQYAGQVLVDVSIMIDKQGQREPTAENLELLDDMATFQGNFAAMLSALRGYVTTRNRIYRGEYDVNLADNNNAWENLLSKRDNLTDTQKALLDSIEKNRADFLDLPDRLFNIMEDKDPELHWREDLYLFTSQSVPLADKMLGSLNNLVQDQQTTLQSDLASGRETVTTANILILGGGVTTLVVAFIMAFALRSTIAQPVRRLTKIAEQIRGGDLEAQAKVESRDEIGVLAATFNSMTAKLRNTLFQVRKEKKRADDLLEVVIPIGVELSTEKDFNRLLEKMLLETKSFCHADTGILYMLSGDKNLEFVIASSASLNLALGGTTGNAIGYAALPIATDSPLKNVVAQTASEGVTFNLSGADQLAAYDLWGSDEKNQIWRDYPVASLLAIPLKNSAGKVLGALQLINAQEPDLGQIIPFDPNLQEMMESFSSLAVAALEAFAREQKLKQEIQKLRIEIDEVKRQKQVSEIVESDFFKDLSARAKEMRNRQSGGKSE